MSPCDSESKFHNLLLCLLCHLANDCTLFLIVWGFFLGGGEARSFSFAELKASVCTRFSFFKVGPEVKFIKHSRQAQTQLHPLKSPVLYLVMLKYSTEQVSLLSCPLISAFLLSRSAEFSTTKSHYAR